MHSNVHSSVIYNHQDMEATWVFINKWMDTEDMVHTHTMEYYSANKKNEILPFAAIWMDLEVIILSEISQLEQEKYV